MATTSVYFPEGLVEELDRMAAERGISRNKLIVEACRHALSPRRQWPDDFFSNSHLRADDLAELHRGADEFLSEIISSRRNRSIPPL